MDACSRDGRTGTTRRELLAASAGAAAAASVPRPAHAQTRRGGQRPVFVQIFLRGGMDGLTAIVPYAESALYQWRPTLAVPRPGQPLGAIDIDGFFGFAPSTVVPVSVILDDERVLNFDFDIFSCELTPVSN